MKYTIAEFRKEYPNDSVCLDKIFQLRFGDLKECPHCKAETTFRRITTRRAFQCRLCYGQIYPCAGTPFEKTRTPLNYWFYAMYLMTVTRNGVAAKELERVLGVTYKTAWRMNKQIRQLMKEIKVRKLKGVVELDEVYLGGSNERSQFNKKTPVFAMVERLGEVKAMRVDNTQMKTIYPLINANVEKSAKINTDESVIYQAIKKSGFASHEVVKHVAKEYVRGNVSTNTVEGFFAQLRRMIEGTHIHVSDKFLQDYLNEACFRYNNRHKDVDMFGTLLNQISIYEA